MGIKKICFINLLFSLSYKILWCNNFIIKKIKKVKSVFKKIRGSSMALCTEIRSLCKLVIKTFVVKRKYFKTNHYFKTQN